jgi:hypothetical protein
MKIHRLYTDDKGESLYHRSEYIGTQAGRLSKLPHRDLFQEVPQPRP